MHSRNSPAHLADGAAGLRNLEAIARKKQCIALLKAGRSLHGKVQRHEESAGGFGEKNHDVPLNQNKL